MKVFFNQKSCHRERQQDTYIYGKELVEGFSGLKEKTDNLKIEGEKSNIFLRFIIGLIQIIPIINLRKISYFPEDIDYIYTWGDIPFSTRKNYVVELDNPYVLTLYNVFAFSLYKPIIKYFLKKKNCKKIVCISDACRKSFLALIGDDLSFKTVVLYPRMSDEEMSKKDIKPPFSKKDFLTVNRFPAILLDKTLPTQEGQSISKKARFVFVGFDLARKGGLELLEAFHRIDNSNIELKMIGFKDEIIEEKYREDIRILFLGKLPRNTIIDVVFLESDVFVFPTLHESFGMVVLEALSRGLGIITTSVYALPELVIDGYNGKILKHPFLGLNELGIVDVTDITIDDFYKKFLENKPINADLVNQIEMALLSSVSNYTTWKENSVRLYREKFSQEKWEQSFLDIFK